MKFIVILSAIIAGALAHPSGLGYARTVVVPAAVSSQYHAQDELGQYSYGYSDILSSKSELKTADGITQGGYSYVDAEGKLQSVQYTSDAVNGFRVAATNLPVAPEPIPSEPLVAPTPVEDTPEVVAAKAKHFQAVEDAKVRTAAAEVESNVVAPVAAVRYVAPVATVAGLAPVGSVARVAAPLISPLSYSYGIAAPAFGYSFGEQPIAYSALPVGYGYSYGIGPFATPELAVAKPERVTEA